jgi:death-on-curing protein
MNWRWIKTETVLAVHEEQLVAHGGSNGVNLDLLESALQRPQNKDHYGHDSTPAELAAAYAFGIVKNHPFVDGNKRTGFLAAYAFLGKNGLDFDPPVQDVVIVIESLAAGKMTEADLVAWFKQWIRGELEPASVNWHRIPPLLDF